MSLLLSQSDKSTPKFLYRHTLFGTGVGCKQSGLIECENHQFRNRMYGGSDLRSKYNHIVNGTIFEALGFESEHNRNSRRAALTKIKHALHNLCGVPMSEIRLIGDTDALGVQSLIAKYDIRGSFIGNGGRSDFVIWRRDKPLKMSMFIFTQKSFAIVESEPWDGRGYQFVSTGLNWQPKPTLKVKEMPEKEVEVKEIKPEVKTQSFNEMFADISDKFNKKTYVPPKTFKIKTRIFKDTSDFDAQYDDKELEKLMGKADEFVSAMVDSGFTDTKSIHRLAVDLSVNHGVDYRNGKWFKKGDVIYHYFGTQKSKIFVIEKGTYHAFPLEVKTCKSTQAVMHTCELPIEFEGKFKYFIEATL